MMIDMKIMTKLTFLPSLRSWTPLGSCQCWPWSRQKGSSSSCPAPLSENHRFDINADAGDLDHDDDGVHDDDDDGDDGVHDYDNYGDDDDDDDVVYDVADADGDDHLDGVKLLDLNLDPGDVVVVEVLHLLQLVLKPEIYDFFFENIITFVITVIIIIIIIIWVQRYCWF